MSFKKDIRIDEYINDSSEVAKPLLVLLRKTIHRLCPGVTETIKWNTPFFLFEDKILCGIGGFKAHSAIGFWNDSYRKIVTKQDIPSDTQFKALIKKTLESQKEKKSLKKKAVKKAISKK